MRLQILLVLQSYLEEVVPKICLVWMIPYMAQIKRHGILDESSLRVVIPDEKLHH
jgi:hypothetical protein